MSRQFDRGQQSQLQPSRPQDRMDEAEEASPPAQGFRIPAVREGGGGLFPGQSAPLPVALHAPHRPVPPQQPPAFQFGGLGDSDPFAAPAPVVPSRGGQSRGRLQQARIRQDYSTYRGEPLEEPQEEEDDADNSSPYEASGRRGGTKRRAEELNAQAVNARVQANAREQQQQQQAQSRRARFQAGLKPVDSTQAASAPWTQEWERAQGPTTPVKDWSVSQKRHKVAEIQERIKDELDARAPSFAQRSAARIPAATPVTIPLFPDADTPSPRSVSVLPQPLLRQVESSVGGQADLRASQGVHSWGQVPLQAAKGLGDLSSKVAAAVTTGVLGSGMAGAASVPSAIEGFLSLANLEADVELTKSKVLALGKMAHTAEQMAQVQAMYEAAQTALSAAAPWFYTAVAAAGMGTAVLGSRYAYTSRLETLQGRYAREVDRLAGLEAASRLNEVEAQERVLGMAQQQRYQQAAIQQQMELSEAALQEQQRSGTSAEAAASSALRAQQVTIEIAEEALVGQGRQLAIQSVSTLQNLYRTLRSQEYTNADIIKYYLTLVEDGAVDWDTARRILMGTIPPENLETYAAGLNADNAKRAMTRGVWKAQGYSKTGISQVVTHFMKSGKGIQLDPDVQPGAVKGARAQLQQRVEQAQFKLANSGVDQRQLRSLGDYDQRLFNEHSENACAPGSQAPGCVLMAMQEGKFDPGKDMWTKASDAGQTAPSPSQQQAFGIFQKMLTDSRWAPAIQDQSLLQQFWLYRWMGPLCSKWVGPGQEVIRLDQPSAAASSRGQLQLFTSDICRVRFAFLKSMLFHSLLFLFLRQNRLAGLLQKDPFSCLKKQLETDKVGKGILVLDNCCPGKFRLIGVSRDGHIVNRPVSIYESGVAGQNQPLAQIVTSGSAAQGLKDWSFNHEAVLYNVLQYARDAGFDELLGNDCWKYVNSEASSALGARGQVFLPSVVLGYMASFPSGMSQAPQINQRTRTSANIKAYRKLRTKALAKKANIYLKGLGQAVHLTVKPRYLGIPWDRNQPVRDTQMTALAKQFNKVEVARKDANLYHNSDDMGPQLSITDDMKRIRPVEVAANRFARVPNPPLRGETSQQKHARFQAALTQVTARADEAFEQAVMYTLSMTPQTLNTFKQQSLQYLEAYKDISDGGTVDKILQDFFKRTHIGQERRAVEVVRPLGKQVCPDGVIKPTVILNTLMVNPMIMAIATPKPNESGPGKCNWVVVIGDIWFLNPVIEAAQAQNLVYAIHRIEALSHPQTERELSGDQPAALTPGQLELAMAPASGAVATDSIPVQSEKIFRQFTFLKDILYTQYWSTFYGLMG